MLLKMRGGGRTCCIFMPVSRNEWDGQTKIWNGFFVPNCHNPLVMFLAPSCDRMNNFLRLHCGTRLEYIRYIQCSTINSSTMHVYTYSNHCALCYTCLHCIGLWLLLFVLPTYWSLCLQIFLFNVQLTFVTKINLECFFLLKLLCVFVGAVQVQ